ncbi:MAG: hypothetical protein IH604_15405 [Burkholderiales bacterium]|nr:hypothetical protein [Burkholderiales bacterium]
MPSKLTAVSVAPPTEVQYSRGSIKTGIFKQPVAGPVRAGHYNLDEKRLERGGE